jgi:hypothetical protein
VNKYTVPCLIPCVQNSPNCLRICALLTIDHCTQTNDGCQRALRPLLVQKNCFQKRKKKWGENRRRLLLTYSDTVRPHGTVRLGTVLPTRRPFAIQAVVSATRMRGGRLGICEVLPIAQRSLRINCRDVKGRDVAVASKLLP